MLKKFKAFVVEATVSKQNLEKAVAIFVRHLEKKLHTKMYRFGGPAGYTEITHGIGILFFYKRTRAVRFNYVHGEIQSLTVWADYRLGEPGDFTIHLGGLGLLQSAYKLVEILSSPTIHAGEVEVFADPTVKEGFLAEAKRISLENFLDLMVKNHPTGGLHDVPWQFIADTCSAHGFLVPSVVHSVKRPTKRGEGGRFDLTKLVNKNGEPKVDDEGSDKDYYIKITAQDVESNKFVSVKGDAKANKLLTQIQTAVNSPSDEAIKQESKDPNTLFGIMKNLVQLVSRKSRNSLIIYGGPGTGKTYTVTETLKEEGLTKGKDWYVIKGKITTAALYQTLFIHRHGSILVFDDTDSIWGDAEAANILKAALDSYDARTISWLTGRTLNVSKFTDEERAEYEEEVDEKLAKSSDAPDKPIKLPSEFDYDGRIIFISNLPYQKFDSAVLTRSAKIDMTLTTTEMFYRIESIIDKLGDKSIGKDVKLEILDFLKTQSAKGILTNPSMRTFVAAEDIYKSGLPNWKDLLAYT